jgi:UPF0716 protein FxsA
MISRVQFALCTYLLLEISTSVAVFAWLGIGRALALLIAGAVAGMAILRREQFAAFAQIRRGIGLGEPLFEGLSERLLRVIAGLLLILPGVISDVAAGTLLIAPLRRRLIRRLSARFFHGPAGPQVIDGEFHRLDDPLLTSGRKPH